MDQPKRAPTSAFKRCPACGSRAESNADACDICGHVFGETQAIPRAEMEAAVRRQQAAAEPVVEAKNNDSAATPVALNARPARRSGPPKRVRAAPAVRPRWPVSGVPWGVLGVIAVALALVGGALLVLPRIPGLNSGTPATATSAENAMTQVTPFAPVIAVSPTPGAPVNAAPSATLELVYPTRTPIPPGETLIRAGDTCGGIAQRLGLPLSVFMRFNGLTDNSCTTLRTGDTLQIPPPTATPGPSETPSPLLTPQPATPNQTLPADGLYEVKQGDSCGKIAERFGIAVDDIIRMNSDLGLNQQCLIRAGVTLKLARDNGTPTVQPTAYVIQPPTAVVGYDSPLLLSPVDNAKPDDAVVTLEWLSVGTLKANEWYVVQIQPANAITVPIFETHGTSLKLNNSLLGTDGERSFVWWVQVRQKVGAMSDGAPVYNAMSPPSEARRFVWRASAAIASP